jgi:hypothetical protein
MRFSCCWCWNWYESFSSKINSQLFINLAGITTAYCIAEHDPSKQIILIDDGEICSGETGRTTAHLQIEYDDHYYVIAHMFGDETARLVCQSNHQAVDFIEQVVKKENIDCEFERLPGYLIPAKESHKKDVIDKEFNLRLNQKSRNIQLIIQHLIGFVFQIKDNFIL